MKQLTSLSEVEWIVEGVRQKTPENNYTVAHCIPPIFPSYAKIFHPISEDSAVQSDTLTWQEDAQNFTPQPGIPKSPATHVVQEFIERSTLVYGGARPNSRLVRIRWAQLAWRLGLPFTVTLSSWSFTRRFPGRSWPKRLIGPKEGSLEGPERDALVSVLHRHTKVDCCFFHVWLLATNEWREDLLFEGGLRDASLFPEGVPRVHCTPTHWFPEDRSWLVCTDYDLTFTLVGGSESLVRDLVTNPVLECVLVSSEMRVDRNADVDGTVP